GQTREREPAKKGRSRSRCASHVLADTEEARAAAGRPPAHGPSRLAFADRLIAHSATVLADQPWQRARLGERPVPAAGSVKPPRRRHKTWDMQYSGDR